MPPSSDLRDRLNQPLYDTLAYDATSPRLRFFNEALGQGHSILGCGAKTWIETNMYLQAQIPSTYLFTATGIEFDLFPIEANDNFLANRERVINCAHVELILGSKSYTQVPMSQTTRRQLRKMDGVMFEGEMVDGETVATRESVALLKAIAHWPADQFNRAATTLADLMLGPPGFQFEHDGRIAPLTILGAMNFCVEVKLFAAPKVSGAIGIRCLLHGGLSREIV